MLNDRENCDEMTEATLAANRLIDRLQDKTAKAIKPDAGEELGDVIEELETAPEIRTVRRAADDDPRRYGSSKASLEGKRADWR
jgi:hypothetical protein